MALVDPRVGFFSQKSQSLLNLLPQWHPGRRLRTSNWSKLVNSLVGETLEDFKTQQSRAFRNLYLQTAHLDEPDIIRSVELPATIDLNPKLTNVNILRNGSFVLRSRLDKIGDYWADSGVVNSGSGLFGTRAPELVPASGASASVTQTISDEDSWGVGVKRTFSCWYKIIEWAGGTVPSDHGLVVVVTYHDNTTETFTTNFAAHTDNRWAKATLTITASKTIASYTISGQTSRSASFNITSPVSVDAFQAQAGEDATPWEPNIDDKPNWFPDQTEVSVQIETDQDVIIAEELREFHYEAIPTRATLRESRAIALPANRGGGLVELIDSHNVRWAATWTANRTTNKIRLEGLDPADNYAEADLSFFTGTGTGPKFEEDVSNLTYRCAALFGRWLYVVHEMRDLNGTTVVVLSVCEPRTAYPVSDHLEVKYSISLPLDAGIDYHSLEFRLEDPQHIYVNSPTTEYVIRLYYDYAIIDAQLLRMFLREDYSDVAVVR